MRFYKLSIHNTEKEKIIITKIKNIGKEMIE